MQFVQLNQERKILLRIKVFFSAKVQLATSTLPGSFPLFSVLLKADKPVNIMNGFFTLKTIAEKPLT